MILSIDIVDYYGEPMNRQSEYVGPCSNCLCVTPKALHIREISARDSGRFLIRSCCSSGQAIRGAKAPGRVFVCRFPYLGRRVIGQRTGRSPIKCVSVTAHGLPLAERAGD
jgi:hypothetical protein